MQQPKIPVLKRSVAVKKKKEEDPGYEEFQAEQDGESEISYPLMPNDPAAGFIEAQGHYLMHLSFFFAMLFFVDQSDSNTFCFTQTDAGKSEWKMTKVDANANLIMIEFQWLHLIVAGFQMFGHLQIAQYSQMTFFLFKKFFIFASSPIYIYLILTAQDQVYNGKIFYKAGASMTTYKVESDVCIHSNQGNFDSWLRFEIAAFYANLLVLAFYLAESRLWGAYKPKKAEDGANVGSKSSWGIESSVLEHSLTHHAHLTFQGHDDIRIKIVNDELTGLLHDAAAGADGGESKRNQVGPGAINSINESGAELQHISKDNLVSGGSNQDKNREAGVAEIERHQHDFVDPHAKLVAAENQDAQADDEIDKVIANNKEMIKEIVDQCKVFKIDNVLCIPAKYILKAIAQTNFQHDLLMSFRQERQFNKVSMLLVILNLIQAFLHADQQYRFDYALQKALAAKYLPDEKIAFHNCAKMTPMFTVMALVSVLQILISVGYVGKKVIHHSVSRAEFKRKFTAVAILLFIFDVVITAVLIPSIFTSSTDLECKSLLKPWFLANLIILFCLIPNIYYQYFLNQQKDILVATFVINSIKMEDVEVFTADEDADQEVEDNDQPFNVIKNQDEQKEGGEPDRTQAVDIPELQLTLKKQTTKLHEEKLFGNQDDKLALTKDIYAYTFYCFIKNPNPVLIGELVIKCFFTIMLQMGIIYFKFDEAMKKDMTVFRGDADLNIVRITCSFVMHLYTFPEIRLAQQMTQYALYNSHKFPEKRIFFPLLIATMKIVGAFSAEIGNIYYIAGYTTISQVIGGYVRMSIITKIDDIMAMTITTVDIGGEYGANPIMYRRRQNIMGDLELVQVWWKHKLFNPLQWFLAIIFLLANRLLRFLYVCVYYYFLPFAILVGIELYQQPDSMRGSMCEMLTSASDCKIGL